MKRGFSIAGLVLATAISTGTSSAFADDLGFADLEERIAELEATVARKGNRKVSLTISGWVNENLVFWDDGTKRDAYVGTNAVEQSRVRFLGEAKVTRDVSAGYVLELGVDGHPSGQWDQEGPDSKRSQSVPDNAVSVRKSLWFLKSKEWGQVSVGQNGTATYHLLDDADLTLTRNVSDAEGPALFLSQFQLRADGKSVGFPGELRWSQILRGFNNSTPGQSGRRNVVRYDSPVWQGFSVVAAWGEDDLWDAALTYKNVLGDFSLLARVGYGESTDPGAFDGVGTECYRVSVPNVLPSFECRWGGAAATVMHKTTGLFVYGGWGKQNIPGLGNPDSETWFIQPGIERKWFELGRTNVFGMYRRDDAGSNPSGGVGMTLGASVEFWQAGVVQHIENADMTLYALYQRADGSIRGDGLTFAPFGTTELDAFQTIVMGAQINF